MVSGGEHIDAQVEEFARDVRGDAEAGRRVFDVHYDEVEIFLGAEVSKAGPEDVPAGFPYDVAGDEKLHGFT